ncbi:PhnB protein [Labilithrix luteola]|uniref:PhnB protein n=1 Tax=Labilithrix luteola TaxID=1391654 RepID=A0A0K1PTX6_9BACT|nr:glyoxalase/bleomycin resistance/extradiol dioxygenase family protein [Labilithrix luteola]AKU96584.1 PhnB protein [Labilithrix luteola]
MPIASLNPYLNLSGNAEKAIKLYETALGAKVEHLMRMGDVPSTDAVSSDDKNRVMHAALRIGPSVLMLSDGSPGDPRIEQSNVSVALHFTDADEATKTFDALAAGGKVTQPLIDTFWGAKFGMLTDAFGVHWMFNCESQKKG